jgi:hypothetical protein
VRQLAAALASIKPSGGMAAALRIAARGSAYGFFGSSFDVPLVVLCVAVVVSVVVVVLVVSVVDGGGVELVVCCACVCVWAGVCWVGPSSTWRSQATAAKTSNPRASDASFFMYNLLAHTIASPCAKDLTAI